MTYRMIALAMLWAGLCFLWFGETEAAATLTVTKTADTDDGVCDADCSLREAISAAASGDTILFSTLFDTPQTIILAGSQLIIDKEITIAGPGADKLTVSGNNQSRVFHVQTLASLSISGMTITGGSADAGGALFNEGTLMVTECHVTANRAGSGAGIGSLFGNTTIRNSTISSNIAENRGGGIWHDSPIGNILTVTNSTISGNTVTGDFGEGGGIWAMSTSAPPDVMIWNSTITNNYPGGVYAQANGLGVDVFSSIIAANQDNSVAPDVAGKFTTSGHNLIGNIGTAEGLVGNFNGSIIGNSVVQADPKLAPLAYNGGPTPTHALLPCSLAIDAGADLGSSTDQRGTPFNRVRDGNGDGVPVVDIGAFEVQIFTPAICNTGPPTIDAANVVVEQGAMGDCPACPWFDIAAVSDPDGLFGVGIFLISANPSNGVTLSNVSMLSLGVFSAQITASCTASDANFTLLVSDGQFQATDILTVTVTPETTPPVIVVRTDPITPFPNDHKYWTLSMGAFITGASDNCDSSLNFDSVVIERVTSDEPEDAPGKSDGDTTSDILIAPDCRSVQLRAERDGKRDGRVYTITLRVRDSSGNTTTATRKVSVPLSQNGNPAIDNGAQYVVTGSCQ